MQLYALSVITLVLGGISAGFDALATRFRLDTFFQPDALVAPGFRIWFGIFTALVGALRLFIPGGDVVIVGNLLPALGGILLGVTLIVQGYVSRSSVESELVERLQTLLVANAGLVGPIGLALGAAHFLFPRVVLI